MAVVRVKGVCEEGDCDCWLYDNEDVGKVGHPPFHGGCTCIAEEKQPLQEEKRMADLTEAQKRAKKKLEIQRKKASKDGKVPAPAVKSKAKAKPVSKATPKPKPKPKKVPYSFMAKNEAAKKRK